MGVSGCHGPLFASPDNWAAPFCGNYHVQKVYLNIVKVAFDASYSHNLHKASKGVMSRARSLVISNLKIPRASK